MKNLQKFTKEKKRKNSYKILIFFKLLKKEEIVSKEKKTQYL
jgi:hypothetical protein